LPEPGESLKGRVLDYLDRHNVMNLASRDAAGAPWSAPVFYARDGFDLFFLSNPDGSRHGQDIGQGAAVAASITEDYQLTGLADWRLIQGVQLEGRAAPVNGEAETARATAAYAAKFPFTAPYLKAIAGFPNVVARLERIIAALPGAADFAATLDNRLYRLTPQAVWFVDNAASFEKRLPVPLDRSPD
jgi:uncharacterized protein YhbP (UPF0306 family)